MFGKDNVSTGASSDISMATQTAYSIVCNYGMSDKVNILMFCILRFQESNSRNKLCSNSLSAVSVARSLVYIDSKACTKQETLL